MMTPLLTRQQSAATILFPSYEGASHHTSREKELLQLCLTILEKERVTTRWSHPPPLLLPFWHV